MKIRKAEKKDISKILKLGKNIKELEFSSEYPFHAKIELEEALKDKNSILLVAEKEKEIIGFIFSKLLSYRGGGWCMLDNIAVKKEERHRGIANLLLETLYKNLKLKKINYIQILEESHHKKTRKFWKNKGFKETKQFIWAERKIK